jgi:hypothetical protein
MSAIAKNRPRKTLDTIAKLMAHKECPHCGKSGTPMTMGRWHFDKCKSLKF